MQPVHNDIDKKKKRGQVFTPGYMVQSMLDWAGYQGPVVIGKHVADNSCGEGAFLTAIVDRYIRQAQAEGMALPEIKRHLRTYIHGMDIDPKAVSQCRRNLDAVASGFGIRGVKWRVFRINTLRGGIFDGLMHYIIGNPPYVRIHNLNDLTCEMAKEQSFNDKGNIDLYLLFFEMSFKMLRVGGQLCYITPVSWLYSKAAETFRRYVVQQNNLLELVDMGHFQVFPGVSTYTLVSRFQAGGTDGPVSYFTFCPQSLSRIKISTFPIEAMYVNSAFCPAPSETLDRIRHIKNASYDGPYTVKCGFATLADKIFMNDHIPDSPFTIPVLKASTGQWLKCFYPYDRDNVPVPYHRIEECPALDIYLQKHKEQLEKRDSRQAGWWQFGRTQALASVWTDKLGINMLLRHVDDIKISFVPQGQGLFNGYYITAPTCDELQKAFGYIRSGTFVDFVKSLKKYKSGGYYTFSPKDLEQYLNYMCNSFS